MKQKLTLAMILITLLILSGCTTFNGFGQNRYKDPASINYFTGTTGITLEFLDEAPPDMVFENSEFDVQTIIHNQGAYDVINEEEILVEIVTDSADTLQLQTQGLENFYLRDAGTVQLYGKSYFYPEGQEEFFAINRYKAREIFTGFEKNTAEFYVTMCYPYRTYFSDEICIDTNADELDVRRQICSSEDRSYSRGQGAPVEIIGVDSNMIPKGAYIEPRFEIHIQHNQDGFVSLYNSSNKDQYTCNNIGDEQVNRLELHAILGNDTLECFPKPVFFRDGKAKVECFLPNSQVLASAANYYTNLKVELKYLYTETFDKTIHVRRTESTSYTGVDNINYGNCPPWEKEQQDGTCISICEYCAQNEDPNNPYCKIIDTNTYTESLKKISDNHGCVYTYSECIEAGEHCILQNSQFCLPGTYCGEPECSYKTSKNDKPDVRLEEGVPEGKIVWYCEDKENTLDLVNACGCKTTSKYAILPNGNLKCDSENLIWNEVTNGKHNPSTARTYFELDATQMGMNPMPAAICLQVFDAQGKNDTKRAFFDCVDKEICFK